MASLTISLSIYSFPCPGSWYRLQSQWKILAFASSTVMSIFPFSLILDAAQTVFLSTGGRLSESDHFNV